MRRLIYENSRGESVEFYNFPFLLDSLTGIGDVEADIRSRKSPHQDGESYLETTLQPRMIDLEGTIVDYNDIPKRRRELSRVCNPKLGLGKITLQHDNDISFIYGVLDSAPIFPDQKEEIYQTFMIPWRCPNPFWLSEDQVEQMAVFEGGLTFPLRLPTTFAQQSPSKSKLILNEGDVETPIEVTFTGPATAPIIIRNETTGKMIEVNQSLLDGEKLVINTEFGKKRVTKVSAAGLETNAFNQINIATSELFQLIAGNNLLSYSTGQDYERAPVIIKWKHRYLAV